MIEVCSANKCCRSFAGGEQTPAPAPAPAKWGKTPAPAPAPAPALRLRCTALDDTSDYGDKTTLCNDVYSSCPQDIVDDCEILFR